MKLLKHTEQQPQRGSIFGTAHSSNYYDQTSNVIGAISDRIKRGDSPEEVFKEYFESSNPWLYNIISSPKRHKILELVEANTRLKVLDVGAGWGQFTLPNLDQSLIVSLEPTPEKIELIQTLANTVNPDAEVYFIGENFQSVEFETQFDRIFVIGVFEWVGKFSDDDPLELQKDFLKRLYDSLAPGGEVILAIENRLGLKYLLGTEDDHTNTKGILYLDTLTAKTIWDEEHGEELRVFTYALHEYLELFKNAGFSIIAPYAAFPDYKLPDHLFAINHAKETETFFLNGGQVFEHSGITGKPLEINRHLNSLYRSFSEIGIAHHFAPSFVFRLLK